MLDRLATTFSHRGRGPRVESGPAVVERLAELLDGDGLRRPVLVTSRHGVAGLVGRLLRTTLGDWAAGWFDGAVRDSPQRSVDAATAAIGTARADVVIAVGGGSAIVTARAAAGDVPIWVVPTTPTTAVDSPGAAIVASDGRRIERTLPRPSRVLLDGRVLAETPGPVFVDSALTTLASVVLQARPGLSPFALADVQAAIGILDEALPELATWRGDAVRLAVAGAALLSNRAGTPLAYGPAMALVHAIREANGAVPQGAAFAALAVADLRVAPRTIPGLGDADALATLVERTASLRRLRDLGIDDRALPAIVDRAHDALGRRGVPVDSMLLRRRLEMAW